ncbi:MAG: inorganic diphosphatase [Gammaproteobacteria bacterium]|jgi:inorganic pyrophosphatase|nr:inorganic diphosphatase [Gammaproteobacteria bacterium]
MTDRSRPSDDADREFDVLVEIPAQGLPVKYEFDKEQHLLRVDRFLSTAMVYPCNYGYIPETLANDGDPLDALVPTPYPLLPASLLRTRPVAVLLMQDEKGEDEKVVAVPTTKLTPAYDGWRDLPDVPDWWRATVAHFFEQYKAHETGKFVKVRGWAGVEEARAVVAAARHRQAT